MKNLLKVLSLFIVLSMFLNLLVSCSNSNSTSSTSSQSNSIVQNTLTPTESTPTESTPTDSIPTDSTPAESTPTESTPTDSTPTKPAATTKVTPTKATSSQSTSTVPLPTATTAPISTGTPVPQYTVSFNSQGGSAVASKTAYYNTNITSPASPTRVGFNFGGWYKEAAAIKLWNFATDKVTANTTLYAKWTIMTKQVFFNSMGGSAVATKTVNYFSTVTAPANPSKSGYIFAGWFINTAYNTPWIFASNKVITNTMLYAKWFALQVTGLSVKSSSYNSLTLTWNATTGARYYEIYRASSSTGTYTILTTVVATSVPTYTNSPLSTNMTLFYKVRAYSLIGTTKIYNNFSNIASAKTVPSTPTGLTSSAASYTSIRLSWSGVAGASGYSVYRSTTFTGTYSLITTVTTNTFTQAYLAPGATFYYKVNAYRLVGSTKVYGNQCAAISARVVPPVPASLVASSPSSNSIRLSWAAVIGANGYSVFRSTSASGTYSLLATITTNLYINSSLGIGTIYFYKVSAYRLVGTTKVYGSPCAPVRKQVVPLTISTFSVARNNATSIIIGWNSISAISGYEIHRSTSSTGTFTLIKTQTEIAYVNTGLVTGTTYYYKVRSYINLGSTKVYSDFSVVKFAKP